jgi:preprotein translocase subunit SecG
VISQLIAAAAPAVAATAAAAKSVAGKATSAPVPANPLPQNLPPIQGTPIPQTWFQAHAGWLTHGVAGIFILACIALIVLLALQTTKQEGLSGTVGGAVQSAYRGRPGAEESLKRVTGFTAVLFVVTGTILSLTGI